MLLFLLEIRILCVNILLDKRMVRENINILIIKKSTYMEDKKKWVVTMVISILIVLVLVSAISYAFFSTQLSGTDQIVKVGELELVVRNIFLELLIMAFKAFFDVKLWIRYLYYPYTVRYN